MTKKQIHSEKQPELKRELQEMISGSYINWSRTKEDIWSDMLVKIESSKPRQPQVIYMHIKRLAVAAVFVISIGIVSAMFLKTKTIINPSEQFATLYLPDSSRVIVKPHTELSYKPLLWKLSRSVKFEGEALFEVEKGKKFEVVSLCAKTIVLGTQFNVYSRENSYNVTCISGKVKVVESVHQNQVILTANQKAILKPDGNFDVEFLTNEQEESSKSIQNSIIEEKLNEIFDEPDQQKGPSEKSKPAASDEKAVANEKVPVPLQDITQGKDEIKEQNKSQMQTLTNEQNIPQSGTSQQQTDNQDQPKVQSTEPNQNRESQQSKDKFRASLTPEQIGILENQQMSREEKRKAFLESLSPEQLELLKEQNRIRAGQTEGTQNATGVTDNIKDQQQMQNREQTRESVGKESQEQQKQQNTDIKENARQGNESGSGQQGGNKDETGKGN